MGAVLLALLLSPSAELEGQQVAILRPVPINPELRPGAARLHDDAAGWALDSVQYPRTYWVEGGLVGGLALGTLSAFVAGGLCGDSDSGDVSCGPAVLGGLLVGGALGFTIGALVGGSVSKPPEPEPAPRPPDPGNQPEAGKAVSARLLGTAILVPTGIAVGLTSSNSLGGALVGGLAGFAVGQLVGTLIDRQAAPANPR